MQRAIGILFFFLGLAFIGEKLLQVLGLSVHLGLPQALGWACVLMGSVTFLINAFALFHLRKLFTNNPEAGEPAGHRAFARGQLEHYGGLLAFSVAAIAIGTVVGLRENVGIWQLGGAALLLFGFSGLAQTLRRQQTAEQYQAALDAGIDLASQRSVKSTQFVIAIGAIGVGIYLFWLRT